MPHPLTRAEQTHFTHTSRHADVMAFVRELQGREDRRLDVQRFGVSPEGRELPLLVLSEHAVRTPEQAHALGLPVVLVLCGIHAGEVEGKEASLMLARDLLDGAHPGLLSRLTLLVVPLFNPDGNDRIDPANRKLVIEKFEGQLGPESGVGTRVNAAGINLNRDYMRQDALEMRLLSRQVYQRWLPHLTIDCHATNGSIHRFDLTYDTPHLPQSGRPEPITFMRERLLPQVSARVLARTGRHTFFYGNFLRDEGGQGQGWTTYTHHPRFGSNYRGLTGRLDLLLETYAYISFPERVATTYQFVEETLEWVGEHGQEVVAVVEASQEPLSEIAVRYELQADGPPATVLTREPYTLEGAPVEVQVPHYSRFVGTERVRRPRAYTLPEALVERFQGHGLAVIRLGEAREVKVEVATVKALAAQGSRKILEASTSGERELDVETRQERRILPAGTWLLPTDQPFGAVAVYLCEPRSDDSVVACGWLEAPAPGEEFPILRILD